MLLSLLVLGHFISRGVYGAAGLYRDQVVARMEDSLRRECGWSDADASGSSGGLRNTPTYSATKRVRDAFATAGLVRARPDIHKHYRRAQSLVNVSVFVTALLCIAIAAAAFLAPYPGAATPPGTYGEHRWQQLLSIAGPLDRAVLSDLLLWGILAVAIPLLALLVNAASASRRPRTKPGLSAIRELLGLEDLPGAYRTATVLRNFAYAWRVAVAVRLAMVVATALW